MVRLYESAVALLPWSDAAIMECDLGRLRLAIDSARKADDEAWKHRYRIAGFEVEDPLPEPADDDEFDDRARQWMAGLKRQKRDQQR